MRDVVLTFAPGDPVPPWFVDVEPRHDVPADLPRMAAPLRFAGQGRVVDEGSRYVVELDGIGALRRAIVGDLYYCHLVVEKPILWADGTYWPGGGVPPPLGWTPDPARVKRIADVERSRAALERAVLYGEEAPAVSGSTYYKALGLLTAGVLIGAAVFPAALWLVRVLS